MGGCGIDIFRRGVYAGYLRPHARKRFTQQPRTTTDIKCGFANQGMTRLAITAKMGVDSGSNEAKPHGIQLVQHGAGTLWVPPFGSQATKMGGLRSVYCRC